MSNLSELLERVESATGPDRHLDAAIAVAMLGTTSIEDDLIYHLVPYRDDRCAPGTYWRKSRSGASLHTAAPFTASLDNALYLVEEKLPGWPTRHHTAAPNRWHFYVMRHEADRDGVMPPHEFRGIGTPPLAVLSALLRALISQEAKADA